MRRIPFSNPGKVVTKYVFAEVFREAWISGIQMSTIINGFQESGICPLNPQAIPESKLAPSLPYSPTETQPQNSEANRKLHDLEEMMKPSTIAHFNTRYEEGYDIEDEFYSIWSKLKTLSISTTGSKSPLNSNTELSPASSKESAEATPLLDEILTYPDPMKAKVKKGKSTSDMPKHLSGEQMIQYLENKRLEKERLEEEKIKRQEEREQNRRKREEEKERKKEERERKSREGAEKEREGFEEKRKYRKGRAERAWWRKWEWQRKRKGKGEGEGEWGSTRARNRK